MSNDPSTLSPRHERFVAEYLKDLNATRAYVRAGYSPRGAQTSASRLLRQPHIAAAVAAGRQQLAAALAVSAERIAQEYAKIAFANVADFVSSDAEGQLRIDLEKASQAQQAGIIELRIRNKSKQEQEVILKLGKLQALAALARQVGGLARKAAPEEPRDLMEEIKAARLRAWGQLEPPEREPPAVAGLGDAGLKNPNPWMTAIERPAEDPDLENPNPSIFPSRREPDEPPVAAESPRDPQGPTRPPAPRGIPPRDSQEFHDLRSKLRRGTLDYPTAQLMIDSGYGLEPEREVSYQMEMEYDPFAPEAMP